MPSEDTQFKKGHGGYLKKEHYKVISEKLKGRKRPPRSKEWSQKISESHKGKSTWNKGKELFHLRKENACRWNGGVSINAGGYKSILVESPGKRELEHRKVWMEHNGEIPEGYVIHHIDGNKLNNEIENLEMMTRIGHSRLHSSIYMQ